MSEDLEDIDAALEELESGQEMKKSQSKIWKILLTVAAVIFLILTGVFFYLWLTVYLKNQSIRSSLKTCNNTIEENQNQIKANDTDLDTCEAANSEKAKTSLGIYSFDTRAFQTNPKVYLGVDKPNELNADKTGIYPIMVSREDNQFTNTLDKGQYPDKDDMKPSNDKRFNLYSFSIKPKNPTIKSTDNCPYWQIINRLDPSWKWELKYGTSIYQTSNDVNYVLYQGTGSTIAGGQIINSGDKTETSTGRVSCVGLGSTSTLTLQSPSGSPIEYKFTTPNMDFVIIMFHSDGDTSTALATMGFLSR